MLQATCGLFGMPIIKYSIQTLTFSILHTVINVIIIGLGSKYFLTGVNCGLFVWCCHNSPVLDSWNRLWLSS